MDHQRLHQFVATVPGSFGDHVARRMAVNMLAGGNAAGAAALVGLVGLDVIPALVEAEIPPAALRTVIENAALFHYRELPGLIAANGGRPAFAAWCRQAEFAGPETLPETVDIFRGTLGCSPAEAATGLHWSLAFDDAAFYAARFADEDLTGVHVIHARVPRSDIAAFIAGTAHQEVIPAEVPASFEVIIDKNRIGDAAVRNGLWIQKIKEGGGWYETGTHGTAERIAREARARMAATGVPRGASIVA